MLALELIIKHRDQREECRQHKKKYIETLNHSHYLRIPITDIDNMHKIIIWKFTEQSNSITSYICDTCGNYCYGDNSIYKNKNGYPRKILCECIIPE